MATTGINGLAVAALAAGGILVYAGFRDISPLEALREVGSGNPVGVAASSVPLPAAPGPGTAASGASGFSSGAGLLQEVQRLGTGKAYSQLRRTGPDSYDCSGLVWRAGANVGLWGPGTKWFPQPFNTASFISHTREIGLTRVGSANLPQAGDIVWWVGHMGVAIDSKTIFAARSSRATPPVGTSSIAGVTRTHGPPQVFRYLSKDTGAGAGGGGGGGASW
jgi:hypothetical protein